MKALLIFLALALLVGCGATATSLPSVVTVELPDGSTVEADQGSGVPSLEDSKWEFFRTAGNLQGAAFVTVVFDDDGALSRFENNTIASEIFGNTILFDGKRHNTTRQGLQYAAATYGAETADASGFAFEGHLEAFAGGLSAANATAIASAEFDPNDPDIVRGTFSFSSRVTLLNIPEGDQDDEFSFFGRRVDVE